MSKNSKYKYLAKNTIIFTISSFGSKILVFLLMPLYTSILSTTDYGIADTITTTASLLIYVFTLNIQDAVLRFAIERDDNPEQYLAVGLRVFGIGSFIFGVMLVLICFYNPFAWKGYVYFSCFYSISLWLYIIFIVITLGLLIR